MGQGERETGRVQQILLGLEWRWCTKEGPLQVIKHAFMECEQIEGKWDSRATARRSYPMPPRRRPGAVAGRSNPCPKPGAAMRGITLSPRSGATAGRSYPFPPRLRPGAATRGVTRSRGCAGAGGPRGAIPHWRSGRAAVRRYPSSKVRSNGCALLEQPWRDTPHPR